MLTRDMLAFKRPARGGLGPERLAEILGKRAACAIPEDEQVTLSQLSY